MSNDDTSKMMRFSLDDLPADDTDWERLKAASEEDVAAAASADIDNPPLNEPQLAAMRRPVGPPIKEQRPAMLPAAE